MPFLTRQQPRVSMHSKNFLLSPYFKVWVSALRLRTLPLALSSIFVGGGLAAADGFFNLSLFVWAIMTALFLQLLSNLANDLGDTLSGADNLERQGPMRGVQSGLISKKSMMKAIVLTGFLAVICGCSLLWLAFQDDLYSLLLFAGIGIAALVAAITYTMGAKPYGYHGLGDVSVFIFFGLVGVSGCYYLFNHVFSAWLILPASVSGLLATAVLNINNIRDEQSDRLAGKHTLVVKLGGHKARIYHLALVSLALFCCLVFLSVFQPNSLGWLAFLLAPWLLIITIKVFKSKDSEILNRCLKFTALATLCFNTLFAVGMQFSLY